jgi:hypothetical protein
MHPGWSQFCFAKLLLAPGPREGLKRKSFFAAQPQKRLERKARFFCPLAGQKNAPNFFTVTCYFLLPPIPCYAAGVG